ncbi:hypothetical protein [Streptomyces bluensis]|uniref:hypothetical protein n=1 Tax=Streptomyces bluensis TaxID=33897 RepID=UPI00331D4C46
MKQLKVAAVLAGSVVVAGAASPAYAAQSADKGSLLDGLGDVTTRTQKGVGAHPVGRTKHGKGAASLTQTVSRGVLKGLGAVK